MNLEFLYESLITTARIAVIIIPLLFIFDLINHRYGEWIESTIKKSRYYMPLLGALFGLLPGCNVAVITAVFYTQGVASMGTLIAAMIATSDEAIYVFIPLGFNFIPIIVAKLILAIIAGYATDLFIKREQAKKEVKPLEHIDFCCAEHPHNNTPKKMLIHALRHGFRIIMIVFIVLLALNFIQDQIKFETLSPIFDFLKPIQPLVLGLVGLIPGCGTSVGIATLYAKGIVTFGAVVAGLSVASGEVIIVLLGQGVPKRKVGEIALILLGFSVIFGFILQYSRINF